MFTFSLKRLTPRTHCISLNIGSSSSDPKVTQSDIWELYSTLKILILKFSDHIQTIVMIISSWILTIPSKCLEWFYGQEFEKTCCQKGLKHTLCYVELLSETNMCGCSFLSTKWMVTEDVRCTCGKTLSTKISNPVPSIRRMLRTGYDGGVYLSWASGRHPLPEQNRAEIGDDRWANER